MGSRRLWFRGGLFLVFVSILSRVVDCTVDLWGKNKIEKKKKLTILQLNSHRFIGAFHQKSRQYQAPRQSRSPCIYIQIKSCLDKRKKAATKA